VGAFYQQATGSPWLGQPFEKKWIVGLGVYIHKNFLWVHFVRKLLELHGSDSHLQLRVLSGRSSVTLSAAA